MKNRLRGYRFLSGKSQDDLAIKTGISQPLISKIERGAIKKLSPEKIQKIAKELGRPVNAVFPKPKKE